MTHTVAVTVLCILTAINFVISLYSHKDDFRKCHNKNESSQILWKYGVIHDDSIPFVIIQYQEYQCQYGQFRKRTRAAVKQVAIANCDHILKDNSKSDV